MFATVVVEVFLKLLRPLCNGFLCNVMKTCMMCIISVVFCHLLINNIVMMMMMMMMMMIMMMMTAVAAAATPMMATLQKTCFICSYTHICVNHTFAIGVDHTFDSNVDHTCTIPVDYTCDSSVGHTCNI